MEFWIILVFIVVIVLSIPFLRLAIKRISMVRRLKSTCKKLGYSIVGTHPLWFFSSWRKKGCDFYIIKADEILCVKLFAMPKYETTLVFMKDNKYFIRKYMKVLPNHGLVMSNPVQSKIKLLPVYDFRYKFRIEWELKRYRKVLLINPVCAEVKYAPTVSDEQTICSTDMVNGYEIASLSRFISFYVEDITI
ncbi:MAG: hypothetical protein IJX51_00095 [Clostridia bacterium]|nr:hypothetical protein [Clostridia bacterium]